MRIDELPESNQIEDRRGTRGLPGGRGGLGIGTVVVLGLIGWAVGIDPRLLIGGAELLSGGGKQQQQQADVDSQIKTGAPSDEIAQKWNGRRSLENPANSTNGPRWSCFRVQHNPAAVPRNRLWARSTARWIKRSISTQVSFRILRDGFADAMSAAKPASSRKPT